MSGNELVLSGSAKVYCVHNREKRQLKTPDDCMRVARNAGMVVLQFPKFHTCGCCENVFATVDDEPQLCHGCQQPNHHKLGGPVNDPIEGVL